MKKVKNPPIQEWEKYIKRGGQSYADLYQAVIPILKDVKANGDKALKKYVEKFDKINVEKFAVTKEEFAEAQNMVSDELKQAIRVAKYNIANFHLAQQEHIKKIETTQGVICWRKSTPIHRVGLYIPSQSAPMFSTILMLGIPANLAGCKDIVLCCTPQPNGKIHPVLLYTADLLNIHQVFKCGGAQAIAAMGYGTESIPKVDKIFGPSNQYVTAAKQLISEQGTAIDMTAGPSELLVIADETANPVFVAADLLSQAEHGESSQVILACTHENFAEAVLKEIEIQTAQQPRKEIIKKALAHSHILIFNNTQEAMNFSNEYAPEHLIINTKDYQYLSEKVINAGSVFLGAYSPESAGDYASGPNHTLPTEGYARTFSGISVDSFVKKITFQELSSKGIQNLGKTVEVMAEAEGLFAHKNAVSVRLEALSKI
jgi:histidinol dehydrogenase